MRVTRFIGGSGRAGSSPAHAIAALMMAYCLVFLVGCGSSGTGPGAETGGASVASGSSASLGALVTPNPGSPLACACGDGCPDGECVSARQAAEMGMYPWVVSITTTGDAALYRAFLNLPTPEYEMVGGAITDDWGLAISSGILNTIYNGPSGASAQHLYEVAILAWLAYEDDESAPTGSDDASVSLTDVMVTVLGLMADDDKTQYDEFLEGWKGLTGEDLAASLSSDAAAMKSFSAAIDGGWFAAQTSEKMSEAWLSIDAALGTDERRIVLLSAARDRAEKGGNQDFAAAADRVIDAYDESVYANLIFNEDGVGLVGSQMATVVTDSVWDALKGENPLLSLGLDAMDILLSNGDDSEANMGMIATYVLSQYLRQGLSDSFMAASSELTAGGEMPSAASFVDNWEAYLEFQVFALDESARWAKTVGDRPWMDQEGAQRVVERSASQQQDRRRMIGLIEQYKDTYFSLADRALTGTCACGCAEATSGVDPSSFSGTYRRVGGTERTWSTFEVAPTDDGLAFSHEATAGYRMFSLTNYQPLTVPFEGPTGTTSVSSLDYGDATLAFTLNDDGSFELSCGIAELDGTYVPADTPQSEGEIAAQEEEDARLAAETLAWLTEGDGVWMLEGADAGHAGVAYLAFAPDGTVTRWLYGYGGAEGTGTYALDGDNITLTLEYFGGRPVGSATYTVHRFSSDDGRRIRLDLVSADEGTVTVGDLSGWYDEGDPWWQRE